MKKILSIGCEIATNDVDAEDVSSRASLLDYDIVIYRPKFAEFLNYAREDYRGKPCLSDSISVSTRESSEHWRREILQAVQIGKMVIIFLSELEEFYIATGEQRHSGTGRNRATTRVVDVYDNYKSIPAELCAVKVNGNAMKIAPGAEIFLRFWKEFASDMKYTAVISPPKGQPILLTKSGDKVVGAVFRSGASNGSLVIMPDLNVERDEFYAEDDDGEFLWTDEAKSFAARLVGAVVELEQGLRATSDVTPEPSWATVAAYEMPLETHLRPQLLVAERDLQDAQKRKEGILAQLAEAGLLRALLFEKGHPLERGIVQALLLLGFKAEPYRDAKSEFDVVFESAEGRLLGEAEGKDSKSINIDKLRQLALNIHEDLERESVMTPAKGVLFGNAHRLTPPEQRADSFTEKCISAAQSSSIALVDTADLFSSAQYISRGAHEDYAKACREILVSGVGVTRLPRPPATVGD